MGWFTDKLDSAKKALEDAKDRMIPLIDWWKIASLSICIPALLCDCRLLRKTSPGDADGGSADTAETSKSVVDAGTNAASSQKPARPVATGAACAGWTPKPIVSKTEAVALVTAVLKNLQGASAGEGFTMCESFFAKKDAASVSRTIIGPYAHRPLAKWSEVSMDHMTKGSVTYFTVEALEETFDNSGVSYIDADQVYDELRRNIDLHVVADSDGRILSWQEVPSSTNYRVAKDVSPSLACTVIPIAPESKDFGHMYAGTTEAKALAHYGLVTRLKPGTKVHSTGVSLYHRYGNGEVEAVQLLSAKKQCWVIANYTMARVEDPDEAEFLGTFLESASP